METRTENYGMPQYDADADRDTSARGHQNGSVKWSNPLVSRSTNATWRNICVRAQLSLYERTRDLRMDPATWAMYTTDYLLRQGRNISYTPNIGAANTIIIVRCWQQTGLDNLCI